MQTLRVANIGDSGFIVVRGTAVVARSKSMVHGFNFPYQIGTEGDNPELSEVKTSRNYLWVQSNRSCGKGVCFCPAIVG